MSEDWQEWRGHTIGGVDVESIHPSHRIFDVKGPNGKVLPGCRIVQHWDTYDNSHQYYGRVESCPVLGAITVDGFEIKLDRQALLRRVPESIEAEVKTRKEERLEALLAEERDLLAKLSAVRAKIQGEQ